MGKPTLTRFLLSALYTRRDQIAWRAWYRTKRLLLQLPGLSGMARRWVHRKTAPEREIRSVPLPTALMPPSGSVHRHGDAWVWSFTHQTRQDEAGIRWHRSDLTHSRQSWLFHLHAMAYLPSLSDESLETLLIDWMNANPAHGQGHYAYAWHSYVLSIRVAALVRELAERGNRLSPATVARASESVFQQLTYLERNLEWDLLGNHLIKNARALLTGGRFFRGRRAEGWRRIAGEILEREIREQILPDGMHYERSHSYHIQVFIDLMMCWILLGEGRLKQELGAKLDDMAVVTALLTHPDGTPSLLNDGGLHMSPSPTECLDVWKNVSGGRPTPSGHFALPDAGYFGCREHDAVVIFDCGSAAPDFLPAHAHGDMLSFEWSVAGRRIIVDAGNFTYDPGAMRDACRSTRMHNTVTLDDRDQSDFWGAHRMARRARATVHSFVVRENGIAVEGSHDGFQHLKGSPRHHRRFEASCSRIDVVDTIQGGQGHSVKARLLFHPSCQVQSVPGGLQIRREELEIMLKSASPIRVEPCWWAPDAGVQECCAQAVLDYGHAPCASEFSLELRL